MAKTTFIDTETVIEAEWLNEVNRAVFDAIGDGTDAPTTGAEVRTNIEAAKSGANSDITSLDSAAGVAVHGTNTNDSAAAGYVGEYVESSIASGSAVALTTGTVANVTSISLTVGDWDVFGNVLYNPAATTSITQYRAGSSLTSATAQDPYFARQIFPAVVSGAGTGVLAIPIPTRRISVASTTTVYLIALGTFTVATLSAYGYIAARRVR